MLFSVTGCGSSNSKNIEDGTFIGEITKVSNIKQEFYDNKIREKLSPNIIETLYNICKIKDEGIKYNDKDIENIVVSINEYIDYLTRGTLSPFFS